MIIEIRNGKICARHNLSDIIKAPPIDELVGAGGGTFLGGDGILQKEVPYRVSNITSHNQTTTNHTKILTQVHILDETFVSLGDEYILNVLHEVQLHEEVEVGNVIYPWYQSHLQLGSPNRGVSTLTPRIDVINYKGN